MGILYKPKSGRIHARNVPIFEKPCPNSAQSRPKFQMSVGISMESDEQFSKTFNGHQLFKGRPVIGLPHDLSSHFQLLLSSLQSA